jgi:ankyrin repeat protein
MVVLAGLILFQASDGVFAQGRPDYQTVGEFLSAIQRNDTNAASQLLESHTNLVFFRDNGSKLPLLEAVAAGNVPLVKRMLELGTDVNAAGDTMMSGGSQSTALHVAVRYNRLEVCNVLLNAGANPNRVAFGFETPLHLAFAENREEIAACLLDHGADPFQEKIYENDRTTPFELAVTRSNGRLVPRMLKGMKPDSIAAKSPIALAMAKAYQHKLPTFAEFLSNHGPELLSAAARRGELEAVQALLKAGVSARTNSEGKPPLLRAFALSAAEAAKARASALEQWQQTTNKLKEYATSADPHFLAQLQSREAEQAAKVEALAPERWQRILDQLIKNGADYDAFAATALGDTNQAQHLLSADKNVIQSRDGDGQTPLHWAVMTDQLPLTTFWLHAGVPTAATNSAGQTALHLAAAKGLAEHLKILLAAQAPTNVRDTNDWTPLDAAIQTKQTETIRLLLSDKTIAPRPDRAIATPLHETASGGNLAALAALTETTNNLEARNELGLTPLQAAVQNGHLGEAALLVDRGANVNVRDSDGNTLLHRILLQDQLIIRNRPPTNWLARAGQDPLRETYLKYLTVGQYEQGPNPLLQAASFLLACGADAAATNHAGETALQLITDEKTGRGVFFFNDDRTKLLQLLGARGGNVNQADAQGDTALHRAAMGYNDSLDEKVPALIASGAGVNATNRQGRTPLHVAVEKIAAWPSNPGGPNNALLTLIEAKANVNAQDNEGLTPLHVLALADTSFREEATRALLDAGANPNLRDRHGRTPAHLFLSGKWPWNEAGECVEMLAKAGADLSAKDDQGKTPLHYLAGLGGPSQSSLFFVHNIGDTFIAAKVDIEVRDNDGNTPLLVAAKTGTHDVFNWLVKQGAGLDETNNSGETPRLLAAHDKNPFAHLRSNNSPDTDVFQAVREGKIEALTALFRADPKLVDETNLFGQTPLRAAVMAHCTNVVEFLIQHGARWDAVSAAMLGHVGPLKEILARQPGEITNATLYGSSLLHPAAAQDSGETVQVLIAAGGDVQAQNRRGISPLGVALLHHQPQNADLLRKRGATENFFDAVFLDRRDIAAALLAEDKSLARATNAAGVAVAEIAAATGHKNVLGLLLDKGVSLNYTNRRDGRTLLHAAAFFNQSNTAALLLRRGAKVGISDQKGCTPLHLAASRGSEEVAVLLLKHHADPNARIDAPPNAWPPPMMMSSSLTVFPGSTPLHLAALGAQTNVIELLLKSGAEVNAINLDGMTPWDLISQRILLFIRSNCVFFQDLSGNLYFDPDDFPEFNRPSLMKSFMARQNAAASLLQQYGAKPGVRRHSYPDMSGPLR